MLHQGGWGGGLQIILQKRRYYLNILRANRVTCSMLHTDVPQISGVTIQSLVARTIWRPAFVHLWATVFKDSSVMACIRYIYY
jgi:hypothetical protein